MRRVVVSGMGIVSSIGNNTQEVLANLREAKSGISRAGKYAELGFRCQVHGAPSLNAEEAIDRRALRFLGGGAAWNHIAMEQAIRDAGLEAAEISNERTGIIMGSGGPSTRAIVEAADIARTKSAKRVGPFAVPKAMSSTASATLATWFKIKGVNYSISSACATSNHCIGNATEVIQSGKQDVIFAGGCGGLDWTLSVLVASINPQATSTPMGDIKEIEAIREVLGEHCPPISATKSLTGHSLGAAGAQEAIYSLLMMNNGFICESANIDNLDPSFAEVPIMRERRDDVKLGCVLSNSFGFGGTNASVVLKRLDV